VTAIRRNDDNNDDLVKFVEDSANRVGKAVEIPAPDGRSQAGWVAIQQLKLNPEAHVMLEMLREHKLFKGKWKTASQVAWSMIYLGLRACYQFYENDQSFKDYRSNFMALNNALQEWENVKKQETLLLATKRLRAVVHQYLNKQTAFGRYRAWVTLDHAIKTRDMVEDVKSFDQNMRAPSAPLAEGTLIFDNRAGEYWERLFPVLAGPLDEHAADELYVQLTQEYFDEIEAANAPQHED
jgi:hypothetical protein